MVFGLFQLLTLSMFMYAMSCNVDNFDYFWNTANMGVYSQLVYSGTGPQTHAWKFQIDMCW